MVSMVARTCRNKACRKAFQARSADVNRGWGLFCCKSCKANSPKVSPGARAYSRAAPPPGRPRIIKPAQQESMYELGTNETAKWDDSAWLANG